MSGAATSTAGGHAFAPTPAMAPASSSLFAGVGPSPADHDTAPAPSAAFTTSLADLPVTGAAPVVQRKCAACEEEDKKVRRQVEIEEEDENAGTNVQPSLEVGPAGDHYEREADSIATRVMAMPAGPSLTASGAHPNVQRACAACDSEEDTVRRQVDVEMDDEEEVRAQPAAASLGTRLAASAGDLTTGGRPLPDETREFFEPRMGRDLSDVRVHQGGEANSLNESIRGRAFAYNNHVWLGAGEGTRPSFTMAHELAHVLQQTSPGPLRSDENVMEGPHASGSTPKVRRTSGTIFYQEKGKPLPKTHDEVLNWLTRQDSNLYGEVPVPNANSIKQVVSKKRFGRADLINFGSGANAVPVGMAAQSCPAAQRGNWYCTSDARPQKPTPLDEGTISGQTQHIIKSGSSWGGQANTSLPRFGRVSGARKPKMGFVRDAGGIEKAAKPSVTTPSNAIPPLVETKVAIGDVKAGAFPEAHRKAVIQIKEYMLGFGKSSTLYDKVATGVEQKRQEIKAAGETDFSSLPPALTPWKMDFDILTKISGVGKLARVTTQPRDLVLAEWRSGRGGEVISTPASGKTSDKGHLYVWYEDKFPGAWSYLWEPVGGTKAKEFQALGSDPTHTGLADTAECLSDALMMTPTVAGRKPKTGKATAKVSKAPGCLARKRPIATPSRARVQRDKDKPKGKAAPSAVDPFKTHYQKWTAAQSKLRTDTSAYTKTEKGQKRQAFLQELEARRNAAEAIPGRKATKVFTEKDRKALEANEKSQFWIELFASKKGTKIGELRKRFGTVFVKLVGAYVRVKEKIRKYFSELKPKKPGSGIGKAALKIAAKILGAIGRFVLPKVGEALTQCIEDGFRNTLNEMFGDGPIASLREKLETAQASAEEFRTKALAPIEELAESIKAEVQTKVDGVKDSAQFIGDVIKLGTKAFTAVRLAICAAGGAETLGAACVVAGLDALLSLIGLSPLEALAAALLGTCMGQTLIAEGLYSFQAVKTLPKDIANWIIEFVRPKLPEGARSLLCETGTIQVELPKISEITCGKGGSPDATPGPGADGKGRVAKADPGAGGNDGETPSAGRSPAGVGGGETESAPNGEHVTQTSKAGGADDLTRTGDHFIIHTAIEPGRIAKDGPLPVSITVVIRAMTFEPSTQRIVVLRTYTERGVRKAEFYFPDNFTLKKTVYTNDAKTEGYYRKYSPYLPGDAIGPEAARTGELKGGQP